MLVQCVVLPRPQVEVLVSEGLWHLLAVEVQPLQPLPPGLIHVELQPEGGPPLFGASAAALVVSSHALCTELLPPLGQELLAASVAAALPALPLVTRGRRVSSVRADGVGGGEGGSSSNNSSRRNLSPRGQSTSTPSGRLAGAAAMLHDMGLLMGLMHTVQVGRVRSCSPVACLCRQCV
jgi:hypothetical protein